MNTRRRIYLFLVGVILGSIITWFFVLKNRNIYKSPQEVILGRLKSNPLQFSEHSLCRLECTHLTSDEVKALLVDGDVNYSESKVHEKPCPFYAVEGKAKDGREIRAVFESCDSTAKVVTVMNLSAGIDTCECK